MGRVKLKLKRLENNTCRQTTFSKRKNGLIKKANELSILCDIDIVLLMFSPSGKPTLFKGQNSSIEDMILKFAQLTPHERAKRKLESLEALKRAFKKLDHDVNLEEFFGPSYQSIEDLTDQVNSLRTQLSEVHKRLSYWSNLDKIGNTVHLGQMEDSLKESLNRIRTHKENLVKQQQLAIQCANEFENGMHVPFSLGIEQQFQPLSWILDGHSQHITLSKDLNLFSHRNTECSKGTSFENYSGYFGVSEKVDISRVGHESSSLGELSTTESLRLQMCEQQHPCPSYNFNLLCDNKAFQPPAQPNMQESTSNFCFDENFEFPQSGYNLSHHGWTSTSGSYTLEMFDEKLFPQQQYSSDDLVASDLDHMYVRGTHHPGVTN